MKLFLSIQRLDSKRIRLWLQALQWKCRPCAWFLYSLENNPTGCDRGFVNRKQIRPQKGIFKNDLLPLLLPLGLLLGNRIPASGLVINPVFDSSITGDPNATTIMNTINSAIAVYEASFSDPITVTITFMEKTSGLGSSSTFVTTKTYSSYFSRLSADATTAYDAIALAHLPGGTNNPVNGNTSMDLTTANARAIGYNSNPPSGQSDGTISLNTSIMNLDRSSIDPNKYDLFAVASHEIDEVLGFGTALDGLTNGAATPTGAVWGMDLFRYDQNGSRSFDTTLSSQAYFSIDGTTQLERFNQTAGGDFSDWFSTGPHTPRVQDAFATRGVIPNLNVELIGLDVLGYDFLVPTLTITPNGPTQATISWTPDTPGFVLQESTDLSPASWVDSPSGSINPVTISTDGDLKFYRLNHP
jgi:hypothetical protein